ncbi:hypothetical protein GHK86_05815 [Acidimicrobiaceae bacterium USS-CC1]|uniref:Uncharacterized protein n=1 Tax=Acidiferrimicrobium australe TaxID=2664430 RepID=A0ABW9QR90_9ACTN|nr:hypothetical protein [Acidiferrimicrobium australe]
MNWVGVLISCASASLSRAAEVLTEAELVGHVLHRGDDRPRPPVLVTHPRRR